MRRNITKSGCFEHDTGVIVERNQDSHLIDPGTQ
jgi:hypothetical protein